MKPEKKAHGMNHAAHGKFAFAIFAANATHALTTLLWRECICQHFPQRQEPKIAVKLTI